MRGAGDNDRPSKRRFGRASWKYWAAGSSGRRGGRVRRCQVGWDGREGVGVGQYAVKRQGGAGILEGAPGTHRRVLRPCRPRQPSFIHLIIFIIIVITKECAYIELSITLHFAEKHWCLGHISHWFGLIFLSVLYWACLVYWEREPMKSVNPWFGSSWLAQFQQARSIELRKSIWIQTVYVFDSGLMVGPFHPTITEIKPS